MRALSGFIGFKGSVGGMVSQRSNVRAQRGHAVDTAVLEYTQGRWNSLCSGEMLRYDEELRLRRQSPGVGLTLRLESAGSKQD